MKLDWHPDSEKIQSSDGYKAGFKTGRNWKHNYVPGGPSVSHDDEASKENKRVWLIGFHEGLNKNRYKNTPDVKELLDKLSGVIKNEKSICSVCGHQWITGNTGTHSCTDTLLKTIKEQQLRIKDLEERGSIRFILDGEHKTQRYSFDHILEFDEEYVIQNEEECDCDLNESVNHCEGDCNKFENSKITGYELV